MTIATLRHRREDAVAVAIFAALVVAASIGWVNALSVGGAGFVVAIGAS